MRRHWITMIAATMLLLPACNSEDPAPPISEKEIDELDVPELDTGVEADPGEVAPEETNRGESATEGAPGTNKTPAPGETSTTP